MRAIPALFLLALALGAALASASAAPAAEVSTGVLSTGTSYECPVDDIGQSEGYCVCNGSYLDCKAMLDEVCEPIPEGGKESDIFSCGTKACSCIKKGHRTIVSPNNIVGELVGPGNFAAPTDGSPPGIISPNNVVPTGPAGGVSIATGADSIGTCLPEWPGCCQPGNDAWPTCSIKDIFGPLGPLGSVRMAPRDAVPVVNQCLEADDRRVRLSRPNNTRLQCCSAQLGYCVDCPQDMNSGCAVGPNSNTWANQIDGELPEVVRPRSSQRESGGSTSPDGDCRLCVD